jgi:uncharacterized membrane protein YgcG
MSSAAPAEALLTTGVSGEQFLLQASTPDTPRQYAERSMAPRFCCDRGGWAGRQAVCVCVCVCVGGGSSGGGGAVVRWRRGSGMRAS